MSVTHNHEPDLVMSGKKILVIDDDLDNVTFVETVLRKAGYTTIYATDGAQGVKKVFTESPDLVVLDLQMPAMNGFEVFKCIREDATAKKIPVVMLTGIREHIGRGYSKQDLKAFYGAEPEAYLEKPVAPDQLLEAVKKHL